MAEEVLVIEPLTDKMIQAGEVLLKALPSAGVEVSAAFWLFRSEAMEWLCTLASPQVDTEGPRSVYEKIWSSLYKESKSVEPDYTNITLVSPEKKVVRALATVEKSYGASGKRFTRSNLSGVYVEDMYVYFVKDTVQPLSGPGWHNQ